MLRRAVTYCLLFLLLILLLLGSAYYYFLHHAFVVVPGQVYRSSALAEHDLTKVVKEKHIRSIINLTGFNPESSYYKGELAVSSRHGVNAYEIPFSAYSPPYWPSLQSLIYLLQHAPKPILVHCTSGVDRTGLAAVITLILRGDDINTVKKQVSWRYFRIRHKSVGFQVVTAYGRWLKKHKLRSSRLRFLRWINISRFPGKPGGLLV